MPRLPHAAKTLISEVAAIKPRAKAEPVGDTDGFGVYRTIRFNPKAAEWLAPLLDTLKDPRIREHRLTAAGYLHVTFVSRRPADLTHPFRLAEADTVMGSK